MSNKTQLPVEVVEEIKMSAKKEADAFIKKTPKKVISRAGLENICAASYGAGATAWAPWKVKHDELKLQLETLSTKTLDFAKVAEWGTNELVRQYSELKERCDKMEAALKDIIKMSNAGKTLSHIDSHVAAKAREALAEGGSNAPAPVQGEKEVELQTNAETIEFCYRDQDGGVQIRYRRIEGTPECNAMIAEVEALIEKAKPLISPYFYRKEGEKDSTQ